MSNRRIAVIFDNTVRRDTTGVYCRRALGQFADVEHFLPSDLARLARENFDLYLAIDDGLNYPIPPELHPSAYWAIDTHLNFERELQRARQFDCVFAAQRDGTNRLRQQGIPNALWLPLACDPEMHAKQDVPKQYDVCFVGNIFPGAREEMVRLIQERFPNSFVGRRFFAEMAATLSASRIVFNRSLETDINMRVFEALASGSLLLTNDLRTNGQDELFRDGLHLATYRDADELVDKIDFYLRNPGLRERVAESGRQAVLAQHTYQHRMQMILETVDRQLASRRPPAKEVAARAPGPNENSVEKGRPPSSRPHQKGLTSIILVTYGQLEYTRLCLDSLPKCTKEPYEVVVVDNGSTDGTVDYLRLRKDIKFIANSENRGFPAAANQGMLMAKGEYILLLNNDTVVATDWLKRMLDLMRSDAQIGLVGPCSNNVSGEQRIPVTYDRLDDIDAFARKWGQANDRQSVDTDRLVGFCLLIRREVIDRIGLLDERFRIGNFEDDDFCRRALQAGFRAAIALSSFVHHFGSRTFSASGVDFGKLLSENERKFREKWGLTDTSEVPIRYGHLQNGASCPDSTPSKPVAFGLPASQSSIAETPVEKKHSRSRYAIKRGPHRGLLLLPNHVRLSLCMIVRDNESTIGAALESIAPWVDDIVVVDTGSQDRTPEICRGYGARLYEFPWCDDFSAARNESLNHAHGEWVFWMDSDDTISPECGMRLRQLADGAHADNILGYVMQVHCPKPVENGDVAITIVDHVKLIRNRADLRFEGRIHEQLLPAIRRAKGDVLWTDIHVVHSGSDHSPDGWQRKLDRDLRILHRELEESPNHPFVLFNLGMTYADDKRFGKAVGYLEKCLAASNPDESHVRKAFALLTSSLYQSERYDDAWQACKRGLAQFSDDKELLFRMAMLHHHFGRLRDAEATYLKVLSGHEKRHFTSIDQDLAGYKTRHNLAVVYDDMGRLDMAETQWRQIVRQQPGYLDGWRGLTDVLLRAGKLAEVEEVCRDLSSRNGRLVRESVILKAKLAIARHDLPSAIRQFELADQQNPRDLEALRLLCQVLFESGDLDSSEMRLCELTRRDPHDAAAFHNLGTVHFRRKAFAQASEAFARSVDLRPDAPETRLQWGWSLRNCGRLNDAIAAWKGTLQRFPGHAETMAALSAVGATNGFDGPILHDGSSLSTP